MRKNAMKYARKFKLKADNMPFENVKVTSSKDAANYAMQFYDSDIEIYESMFLILLNNANKTIGYVKISQGGITGTLVDVKIIGKYCLETLATGVIMCHNHPSGKLQPSRADKAITEKVKGALGLIDTKLLDHLIVTADSGYYSFADESIL